MPLPPINGVPLQIEAGNSVSFLLQYSLYPVGTYTLTFVLTQGAAAPIPTVATTSGTSFLVTLSTTATAAFLAGNWPWIAYASATGVRKTADQGTLQVLPNLAAAQTPSFAQTMVTALQTVLTTFASTDKKEVDFQGQKFVRQDMKQYQEQYAFWKAIVASEQAALARALGGGDPSRVATVFVPAAGIGIPGPYPYPWGIPPS